MAIERVDKLLVSLGYAPSRTMAQKLIDDGLVEVEQAGLWRYVSKTSEKLSIESTFRVQEHEDQRFVSRAGLKLDAALAHMGIDVNGMKALDIGQSTGGFTDCLLQRDCAHVTGVDVGHGQLVAQLRDDDRVECIEGVNARTLSEDDVPGPYDLVAMDVSFISQTLILPRIPALMAPSAVLISLVKPQFEVGPDGIGKGGIVKNAELYRDVEKKITTLITSLGFAIDAYFDSAIQGGDGNREFFVVATRIEPNK